MALLPRLTALLLLSCTLQLTIGLSTSVPRESDTIILKSRDTAVSGGYNISIEFWLECYTTLLTVDSYSNGSNIDVEFWLHRTLPIVDLVIYDTASELVLNSEGNFFYGTNVSTEEVRPCKFLDPFNSK